MRLHEPKDEDELDVLWLGCFDKKGKLMESCVTSRWLRRCAYQRTRKHKPHPWSVRLI